MSSTGRSSSTTATSLRARLLEETDVQLGCRTSVPGTVSLSPGTNSAANVTRPRPLVLPL